MRRVLSTYLWIQHKLTPAMLDEAARTGAEAIEIFCARAATSITRKAETVREIAQWFADHTTKLHSLHAPTSRDFSPGREGGSPVSHFRSRARPAARRRGRNQARD